MQTNVTLAQLADPETARSENILRKCVHCGFCTATCPTFVLLGDERDSPRGRIYFIKAMLEGNRAPSASEVRHVDRCLSCLSCMTTCPSGVNYMHLVDHGRQHIQERFARSMPHRFLRGMPGCGQQVLAPEVNEATVRLLTRHDIEVVIVAGSGCCGSAVMHVGHKEEAVVFARRNIEAWMREIDGAGLDAIVINASGCGTTVKDYGAMFAHHPLWKAKADQVARLAQHGSD